MKTITGTSNLNEMVNRELISQFTKLNHIEITELLLELLKTGNLNFVHLSNCYTQHLEAENKNQDASIVTLGLMLSVYCSKDKTDLGKTARQHLYESGAYTGKDGSDFGKRLEKEFLNP
jgi:hypothetical protein